MITNSFILAAAFEPLTLAPEQFVCLCIAFIIGLVLSWIAVFICLRNQPKALVALFAGGLFLRILTVLFIVCCAFGLALAGRLSAEVSTILAGIAGYVLGTARAEKKNREDETDDG